MAGTALSEGPRSPSDAVCVAAGLSSCAARVLDVLGAGVVIFQVAGEVLYLNDSGAGILGVAAAATRGMDIAELVAPVEQLLDADPGIGESSEIPIRMRDGSQRQIGFRIAVTQGLMGVPGEQQYVLLFQDITEHARVRGERDRLLRLATVSQLLPSIAHEIKNPLAGIRCLAESVEHELDDAESRADIRAIVSEVDRLRLIVDGLGLVDGSLLSESRRVHLPSEVGTIVRVLAPRAKQLKIGLAAEHEGSETVEANPGVLRLVLLNLIKNALEACSAGDEITVTSRRSHGWLEIAVVDTGCGMPAEVLRRATEPFFTTKVKGSGIGLALVAQVLERSGGSVHLESEPGKGTQVLLRLPQQEQG